MAQSTTVDCGASGSKSLKQSPQLEVQRADAFQRQAARGWRGRTPTPLAGAGLPSPRRAAGCRPARPQPPDQQAQTTTSGRGGAEPLRALAGGPSGPAGRPSAGASRAGSGAEPRRRARRPGVLRRRCRRPAVAAGAAGAAAAGAPPDDRRRGRRRRRASAVTDGRGGRRGGPFAGSPAGGTSGVPACRALRSLRSLRNSPLPCVFAAAGRPAVRPVSGVALTKLYRRCAAGRMPPVRRRDRGGAPHCPQAAGLASSCRRKHVI